MPLPDPPQVVCLGEMLIDFVSTVSGVSLAAAPAFEKAPGGAPANVAVGLARLGVLSAFMGKVGDDDFGHFLADTLRREGVDTHALCYSAEARTALAFVSLGPGGEREFMFYRHPSADMLYAPGEVDEELIRQAHLLHVGSITLISDPARAATLHALEVAADAGKLISYDPNLRLNLWPSAGAAREAILSAMPAAAVVKVSAEELAFLSGLDDFDRSVDALWHDALRLLVVTDGPAGCRYVTPSHRGVVAAFAVEAVDTTGAGDGFVAGLLSQLLLYPDSFADQALLEESLRYANAVGALTTTRRGAIPALPTAAEVAAFLSSR